MKNIFSNKIVKVLVSMVLFIVIWALIDWIIALIGKNPFVFSVKDNLVSPAIAGAVVALLEIFFNKSKNNTKK